MFSRMMMFQRLTRNSKNLKKLLTSSSFLGVITAATCLAQFQNNERMTLNSNSVPSTKLFSSIPREAQVVCTSKAVQDRVAIKIQSLPRVYIYDHCPYCVRVRILLGLKGIKHELVFMANDDFDTPISLVGKKVAPIFEFNGTRGHEVMMESLDIVRRIDEDPTWGPPLLKAASDRTDFRGWMKVHADVFRRLCNPRYAKSNLIPEFAFQAARDTYVARHPLKEPSDYDENLRMTPQFVAEMNAALLKLEPMIFCKDYCTEGGVSYDDIELFAKLRGLTIIEGIIFPPKVKEYIENLANKCDIPLYSKLAF
mmetsp:Transcript_14188/g.18586  ORF Transcript_14188/g.18586 Transcript_14188/m.18586 type:complete len:311 (+) Transcript_14188:73-1005(+)